MKKYKGNNKGYLLPMAIIFIVISVILGMGILYLGGLETIGAAKRLSREKAFYLAEAGAYRAYAHLKNNPGWEPEEEPVSLGDGTFLVEIEDESGNMIVASTGTVSGISETVQLKITKGAGGGPSIFANGIFGSTKLQLTGSSNIRGYDSGDGSAQDAYAGSNDQILLGPSPLCKIFGDASVATGGTINRPNNITGIKKYEEDAVELEEIEIPDPLPAYTQPFDSGITVPQIAIERNRHAVENEGIFNVGTWPVTAATITGGVYHFKEFNITGNRTVTIEGNVVMYIEKDFFKTSGQGHIVLGENATLAVYLLSPDGEINIAGSSSINAGGKPVNLGIYSASSKSINLTGNVQVYGAIYAPSSTVNLTGSSPLRGGLVANTVNLTGAVSVYYDVSLLQETPPGAPGGGGPGGLQIIRWTKPGWANRFQ